MTLSSGWILAALVIWAAGIEKGFAQKGPCEIESERVGGAGLSCTQDGYWKSVQLTGDGRTCVNPRTGKEVKATYTETGTPNCGPCLKETEALLTRTPVAGRYVPACDDFGFYQLIQSDTNTGLSYCANRFTGEKMSAPQKGQVTCGPGFFAAAAQQGPPLGPCPSADGSVVCTSEGFWKSVQAVGSGRQCVHPANGRPIAGTFKEMRDGEPDCGPCRKKLETALTARPLPGRFVPDCDEQGLFRVKQGDPVFGIYFCVNRLTGERTSRPTRGPVDCENVKPAQGQRKKLTKDLRNLE